MSISGNWEKRRVEGFERMGAIDRRAFVKLSGMSAAALVFGAGPFTEEAVAQPSFEDYPFSLGVASGDPSPDGVVLWTRLAPDPLAADGRGGMPRKRVPVRWEVAADRRFREVVKEGSAPARPELGHSVHVEVEGLGPGREYFYRFKAGSETSPVGKTKTFPNLGSAVGELAFAFASCQQYEHGYYTAYRRMSEEDLDLVVHLGDYIYEYGPNEYRAAGGNVRLHEGPEITTLPAYRNRHAQYRTDKDLQAAHHAFPWIVTWDDHEVDNNYADHIPENRDPSQGNATTKSFLARRTAAYQAYYEHMPLRRSSVPSGPDMLLYRRINYGNLVEFNVLDTRQYRDDQANGDGRKPPSPELRDPSRTITGEAQERWLLNGLSRSRSTWNVLAQQVFFAKKDFAAGSEEQYAMDSWDGYPGSRNRVMDFIGERGIPNPVVLTGDVHNNWANELKADFDDENSETLGVEFVGTSITSGGDGSDEAERDEAMAESPHIKFFNGQRGYVRCTVTPDTYQADYRTLPFVKQRGADIYTRASFIVENGDPGLRQVDANQVPSRPASFAESDAERIQAQEEASE